MYASSRMPNYIIEYDLAIKLRCRRSLSDNNFLAWTDGRTDRGNNNIPVFSLENAGKKYKFYNFGNMLENNIAN